MKNTNLNESFNERLQLYEHLWQEGAPYSAVKRLAEIFYCLPQLDEAGRAKWMDQLWKEALPDNVVQVVVAGIEKDAQRIRRILSVGSKWNDDELLLVLQLKIEIEMLLAFLKRRYSHIPSSSFDDIDEDLTRIARSKENKRDFERAVSLMVKNWGLPIDIKWLRSDLSL